MIIENAGPVLFSASQLKANYLKKKAVKKLQLLVIIYGLLEGATEVGNEARFSGVR